VLLAQTLLDELIAHAREEAPNECCGVISLAGGLARGVHRTVNLKASPLAFEVDGLELLRIGAEIEDAGAELGGIYHSHTRTAPYPSQTDINFAANWPGVEWVIVGLADGEPEARSYLIDGGQVAEVAIEICDEEPAR
jgi:[CysO sulfur-carrier protein]-S-L-cysteine hydrolase